MADLYADDIEDQRSYTDEMILRDIRALIETEQREGSMLDYKRDVSDSWPEAAAAFANTFGGIIIFGMDAQDDLPRAMIGFEPRGETKTRLTSTLLSRIQPRPAFQVRVVSHDEDPGREIAIVRVSEGSRPPYMHSKGDQHRVYVRVGAQKAEADYLQLSALIEKRHKVESQAPSFLIDFTGPQSRLQVMERFDSNVHSQNWYRFIIAPDDDRAARPLTRESEHQFEQCLEHIYSAFDRPLVTQFVIRAPQETYYRRRIEVGSEVRVGVSAHGSLGFVTHACIQTNSGPLFKPVDFCRDLIDFFSLAGLFYDKRQYYGGSQLYVNLLIPDKARLFNDEQPRAGPNLFEPPLVHIHANAGTQIRVALYPLTAERFHEYLEAAMNDLVRMAGSVLSQNFRTITQPIVVDALHRLRGITDMA